MKFQLKRGFYGFVAVVTFFNVAVAQLSPQLLQHGFEDEHLIAVVASQNLTQIQTKHLSTQTDPHSGEKAEQFVFQSRALLPDESRVVIALPQSRVFGELRCGIWVKANCPNLRLGMRIKYPRQLDPRTNQPLELDVFGDPYSTPGKWQQLVCQASDDLIQKRLVRVRSQLSDGLRTVTIDERESYVDQLILQFQVPVGQSYVTMDDLEFGPIVRPNQVVGESADQKKLESILTIENDRIRKNGEPFFPIMTLYHAEPLDLIAKTGANMLWIRNYDDQPLLAALADLQIGAVASPPQPEPTEAILGRTGIPAMPEWTAPIWAWMLGINLPAGDRPFISAWANQVRSADRDIHRPIIADVAGDERDYHRQTDLISISQLQIHSSHSSLNHFEDLRGKRAFALPGKQMMTFLQSEASGPMLDYLGDRTNVPIVEPEQILHQGFEAIAAGFKGVGFWKQIPFGTDVPGLQERLHAMRIFAIQVKLLEPFVATSRIIDERPVQIEQSRPTGKRSGFASTPLASRWDRQVTADGTLGLAAGEKPEIRATVFHTDKGLLILLVWHEDGAQCVPGPQTATNVRVLVREIGDVATAWEVTPTSVGQSNLSMERISGGTELTLREFDQYAAIVVTGTAEEAESLQRLARSMRRDAAEAYLQLTESKLSRVRQIQSELEQVGSPPVPHAHSFLNAASQFLQEARKNFDTNRPDEARVSCEKALQQLRTLQRAHWDLAVAPLTAPTTTMEATNFQTLPDHWRLMSSLSKSQGFSENLLPSGNFESEYALSPSPSIGAIESWSAAGQESPHTSLRLISSGANGNTHLSMIVKPDAPPKQRAVLVSPETQVHAGDVIMITGQIRIPHPLKGANHQVEIFDTIVGREGALCIKEKSEVWKPFRLVRQVESDGVFRVRFELLGPGIVDVDNVEIRVKSTSGSARASR
ncbi:hypothetical protein SH668x_001344 [Planctomicrobium sp. SH668]|uniref:hypothetical protein n=1 Tax=Planctomicrobium sp. SH668 TaxID=3448126 RepID=UPI003F5B09FF